MPDTSELRILPPIRFGIHAIDERLLHGGLRRSNWTEYLGNPDQGKTTLSYFMLALEQWRQPNKAVVVYDTEGAFDVDYARAIGVKIPQKKEERDKVFRLHQMVTLEKIGEGLVHYLSPEQVKHISALAVDSLAGSATENQLSDAVFTVQKDGGWKTPSIADFAKLMAQLNPKITSLLMQLPPEDFPNIWAVNQVRVKIDMGGGRPAFLQKESSKVDSPGGKSFKHYAKSRAYIKQGGLPALDEDGEQIGFPVKLEILRNPGGRKGSTDGKSIPHLMIYTSDAPGGGLSRTLTEPFLDDALRAGVVTKSGNWFVFKGKNYQKRIELVQTLMPLFDTYNNPERLALWNEVYNSGVEFEEPVEDGSAVGDDGALVLPAMPPLPFAPAQS